MKKGTDIALAKQFLAAGELVAIPTETVYGLAANGFNTDAVLKIYKAKNRPAFNPLILHVADVEAAAPLTKIFSEKAKILAQKFWPGPLTLVLPKSDLVPDIVTAGNDTVAIRVPNHDLTLELLKTLHFPLAAPSANPSGYISPTEADHVLQQLGEEVQYVLDGGKCSVGIESTIVKVADDKVFILRLGGLSLEKIEAVVGKTETIINTEITEAPGMLVSHYAPKAKVIIGNIASNIAKYRGNKIGVLSFAKGILSDDIVCTIDLSPKGDTDEAARNIFAYLRKLDERHLDIILTEFIPNEGLGRAVNDRLQRAAAERS